MNQTFSFTRFARLHRWLWATKRRTYLIGFCCLTVVATLYLGGVLNTKGVYLIDYQYIPTRVFLVFGLLIVGALASDVFNMLYGQESAITYLMLPASRSEKFWLGVGYCLLSVGLLTIVYFGLEAVMFSIANDRLKPGQTHYVSSLTYFTSHKATGDSYLVMIAYSFLLAMGIGLLGSFYFRKGVYIRNVGIAILAFVGLSFLYRFIVGLQFPDMELGGVLPFIDTSVKEKDTYVQLSLPVWLPYVMYGFILLMLWITARVRFNEIER